jgi:hypothetical protein
MRESPIIPSCHKGVPKDMDIFERWQKSCALLTHSMNVLRAYPVLFVPVMAVWLVFAPCYLYLRFQFHWHQHGTWAQFGVSFLFIAALSVLLLFSCDVVLHLIRQIEGGRPSLGQAVRDAITKDAVRLLPLALTWAIVWFALAVIEALLTRKRSEDDSVDESLDAESAAEALAGDAEFSLSAAFVRALEKGVRMVMFLVVPAIAWEGLGVVEAARRGIDILRENKAEFARGYALTYVATFAAGVPAALVILLGSSRHGPPIVAFPQWVWVGLIIYLGLLWSLSIYLEQLFMAQIYLWHLTWERAVREALDQNKEMPELVDTPCPEMFARSPGLFAV